MTLCWTNYIKMTVLHLWSPSCVEIKKVILRKIKCVLEKSQQIRHALGKRHLKYFLHAHKKRLLGPLKYPPSHRIVYTTAYIHLQYMWVKLGLNNCHICFPAPYAF